MEKFWLLLDVLLVELLCLGCRLISQVPLDLPIHHTLDLSQKTGYRNVDQYKKNYNQDILDKLTVNFIKSYFENYTNKNIGNMWHLLHTWQLAGENCPAMF